MMNRFLAGSAVLLSAAFMVACGGGGGGGGGTAATPTTTGTVASVITPAKGIIYGGIVTAYSADGKVLASGETGSLTSAQPGKATLNIPTSATGAILIKVSGNANTTYFDESTGRNVSGAELSLATAAASINSVATVGVTPFTTMAAKLSGINTVALGTTSYVPPAAINAATIAEGASRTLLTLGLPANINLFAVPTPPSLANPTPAGDILASLLVTIAKSSGLNANSTFAALIDSVPVSAVTSSGAISPVAITNTAAFTSANTAVAAAATSLGITVSVPNLSPSAASVTAVTTAVSNAIAGGTVVVPPTITVPPVTTPVDTPPPAGTGTASGSGSTGG